MPITGHFGPKPVARAVGNTPRRKGGSNQRSTSAALPQSASDDEIAGRENPPKPNFTQGSGLPIAKAFAQVPKATSWQDANRPDGGDRPALGASEHQDHRDT